MFLCINSLLINVVSLMAKDILRLSSSQPRPPLIFKKKVTRLVPLVEQEQLTTP
jgi:hypothetical protein